ncbi:MAG: large subunit ribosomal protein L6 [Candidatus Magnetoglobus multicellularis str. Araruama]|uniref:Large ribosomal subunit protein uL6 n=1 Tax=Candidatus Magnetoglobus multicellularis str. Araruama TaxID=890399 RepID=A0A1V1PI64_9BACT|nr:MAG: large subunit ribosomal protein L6 [Candidatus Magnetoglobus multicellularis str. Araruama]
MSRVGKKPIEIPKDITISYTDNEITVKGKNGSIKTNIHETVKLKIEDQTITVIPRDLSRKNRAYQGMTRSIINNMIIGASKGFERTLEINGIGYRAEAKGNILKLTLGYSHPIEFKLPDGVSASVQKQTIIKLSGIDKQIIGQLCAEIRALRPPEPYKGKGVKYAEEYIQRKAGKTGTK